MILRRVASAFRRQDWFTVFVETMIVVLGVFLGLQVNNWNEARQQANKEQATMSRLLADFEAQEKLLVERVERAEMLTRKSGELLALLRAGDEPADREHIKELIFWCLAVTYRQAPPASYAELVSSGLFAELSAISLRKALVHYGQVNAFWSYLDGQAGAQINEESRFRQAITIVVDTDGFSMSPSIVHDYDWIKLKEAGVAISTIQQLQWQQLELHRRDLAAVRTILSELKGE